MLKIKCDSNCILYDSLLQHQFKSLCFQIFIFSNCDFSVKKIILRVEKNYISNFNVKKKNKNKILKFLSKNKPCFRTYSNLFFYGKKYWLKSARLNIKKSFGLYKQKLIVFRYNLVLIRQGLTKIRCFLNIVNMEVYYDQSLKCWFLKQIPFKKCKIKWTYYHKKLFNSEKSG